MTAIGMTGHQGLTPDTERLVESVIAQQLDGVSDLVGITSLAEGADQLFAQHILDAGGSLIVILPATNYVHAFPEGASRRRYEELLSRATEVVPLPYEVSSEEAYWAAGREVVDRSDRLLAVWNGKPAGGLGGTADVVEYARERDHPTVVIWRLGRSASATLIHWPTCHPSASSRTRRATPGHALERQSEVATSRFATTV